MSARTPLQNLCRALSQALDIPEPALRSQAGKPQGFRLRIDADCEINFAQVPGDPDDLAYALIDLGPADTAACNTLLQANFLAAGAGGPVYSRNPANGHALLQSALRLGAVDGATLLASLRQMAAAAGRWRADASRAAHAQAAAFQRA
ncbi:MAG: CesT family type III secretion system chaperone [Pseudomonadota bacterium]